MPEQADAVHAADSKEAHTDIHQAPNVSHTGEVATADDSSVVQRGEGPCETLGAAGMATCRDGRRAAETVERSAVAEPRPEDTAILFRRNEEGREFRRRAVAGELTPHDIISRVPECFRALLEQLASPISKTTGLPVDCTDYESMIDDDGAPRQFDFAAIRRKLGSIAKQKAPRLSGNGRSTTRCPSMRPLRVTTRHTSHTTLRHEPLEEENVSGGAVHEVTFGSYKHITRSSQRRLSISRLRGKDGPLLATFSRAPGRTNTS